jgi:Tetratricopeptide repeat
MAEERRPSSRPSRGGSASGASRGSAPRGAGSRGGKPARGEDSGRGGSAGRGSSAGRGASTSRGGSASDRPARKGDWKRPADDTRPRSNEQTLYDGPPIPDEITGAELDRSITAQLKGLPEKLAARVARHLAAAGAVLDDDPETAYQHTLAARARASRLAVVREATGEAAYEAGRYAEALAELRAAKRMNGATAYLPMMADCHRALGNPEQALKLAKSPSVANFASDARAEMTLVEAGARRDMGQFDAALRVLERAPISSASREPWVARLRYAYADTLEAAGQLNEALAWFHRTDAIDGDELTDAAERAEQLEKRIEGERDSE